VTATHKIRTLAPVGLVALVLVAGTTAVASVIDISSNHDGHAAAKAPMTRHSNSRAFFSRL